MKKLLIATHNPAKLADLKQLFGDTQFELVSLADLGISYDVNETGTTFEENALLKATTYARLSQLPTIADDSGLMVDALNGEPGIYSARYAGEDATAQQKVVYLLTKMEGIPKEKRQAIFVSTVAYACPNKEPRVFRGELAGLITSEPKGILEEGYPYKLIFEVPEHGKTLAELRDYAPISSTHRARALAQLLEYITDNS